MLSNLVTITVENWKKYNPRPDRDNFTWFRFQNDFYSDPKLFDLESDQRHVLLFCYCELSKKSTGTAVLSLSQIATVLRISVERVHNTLKLLDQLGVITPSFGGKKTAKRPRKGANGSPTDGRTDAQTNETDIHTKSEKEFFNKNLENLEEDRRAFVESLKTGKVTA